ncbi:1-deoxy-D-xylulose-5-phosphate reductoisomerase [Amycolatopsis sp. cg5]|uniref:1-deoxy-D-xylulose-5-phosphate reductoisomerase n=1 Tax=Amycolatopsis sp. cg5 TaxID=3238802 RepID=UPI0035268C92
MTAQRRILILGSTGSIGRQALDIAKRNPHLFAISGIAARGSDPAALARQALEHSVAAIAITHGSAEPVLHALREEARRRGDGAHIGALPQVFAGLAAVSDLIDAVPADVILNGMAGSQGLEPTLCALRTGATVALANKESLVAGGPLVLAAARPEQLVPVDSEHSAIAQALRSGRKEEVARLVLTASGGPFRGHTRARLSQVTPAEALNHPTWSMGPVVTINSATLMNKGLELIEAQLLFGIRASDIEVVVHPQSVVHSMVTFVDGSTLAQASPPDMRLPIALGMHWPRRVDKAAAACTWNSPTSWTFEPLDDEVFPAVQLARYASAAGGCVPAVYNAANEELVAAFLDGKTSFTSIVDTVADVVTAADQWRSEPRDVQDVLAAELWARTAAAGNLRGV